MYRAVIIGSGNVAENFARLLPLRGEVVQIYSRNRSRGEMLAAAAGCPWCGDAAEVVPDADIYIAAVSDRAVAEVLEPLTLHPEAVVVHVSGGQPLEAVPAKFPRRGVLYPLMTFSSGRAVDLALPAWYIEGSDAATTEFIDSFARTFGEGVKIVRADSEQRARIHLAGVLACNFVNAMYGAACETMRAAGLAGSDLRALAAETLCKAFDAAEGGDAEPRAVQTGPAVRGDAATMERHLELIDDPLLAELYRKLSQYIYERKL